MFHNARYYDPGLARFISPDTVVPGAAILTIDGSTKSGGPANPQDLNRFAYVTNNPLRFTDPTGHCGKATFGDTAISVMSGDCTRRAYEAFTRADTTEGKVVSGAVMAASAVGAGAGWAGGILLAAAGGQAIAGAVAGSTTASTAAGSAATVATAANADGDPTNEIRTVAERTITLVQQEGNVVEYALSGPKGQINVMAELVRKGETLILRGTHLEGSRPGSQGIRELREFARLFGREQGVTKVIIEGGIRTTGANPGHTPKDIIIPVK